MSSGNKVYALDPKTRKLVEQLPEVRVGNERLNRPASSRMAGNTLVVCRQHGTLSACYIWRNGLRVLCCWKCIKENCRLSKAVVRLGLYNEGSVMDHPD